MFYEHLEKLAGTRKVKSDEKPLTFGQKYAPHVGGVLGTGTTLAGAHLLGINQKRAIPAHLLGAGAGILAGKKIKARAKKRNFIKSNLGNESDSSMIRNIGQHRGKTYVRFKDGGVYQADMSQKQYDDLLAAESTGKFYNHLRFKQGLKATRQ
mgnify:CR=1 FL=1|tara:strand:+ start:1180 stop:1638 length:459 start_codon:yes stop_codon:yes gene_type:complete